MIPKYGATMPHPQRPRGRPRAFDEEAFLGAVIALFRARGFAGVSMSDITAASGLTVGSIYKAYGDKEGVFDAALAHYISQRDAQNQAALAQRPNSRSKLDALMAIYLGLSIGEDGKLGCMVVSGVADMDLVGRASERLQTQLTAFKASLLALIAEGQADGSIHAHIHPDSTATLLLAMLQGLRVLGKTQMISAIDTEALKAAMLRTLE